jgi:hypothetical protein
MGGAFQPATSAWQAISNDHGGAGASEVVETPVYASTAVGTASSGGEHSYKILRMQQAGFSNVDCVWKHFARAVVYGERPAEA